MRFQYSPYVLPLLAAAILSGGMTFYVWRHRRVSGGVIPLFCLTIAITVWSIGYALEIAGADLATKVFWGKFQYIGIVSIPLFWLIFALTHTYQSRRFSHRMMFLLGIVPLITLALTFTTETHGLVWSVIAVQRAGTFSALKLGHGLWFWINWAYTNILLLVGTVLIVRSIIRGQYVYRGQAAVLLIGVFVPWVGNALYILGLSPIPYLDLTPFAFTFSSVAIVWGIFGSRLIDMVPLARDTVVEEMKDGMFVLDVEGCIVDANAAARRLIGQPNSRLVGRLAEEVFSAWPQIVEQYRHVEETLGEVILGEGESQRWYELHISPLRDRRGRSIGRVVTLRDISARRRAEEQVRQLSRAVEASPTSIVITDSSGSIEYVNPKFTQVTGYTLAEAAGQNPRILKTDRTPPETHRQLWEQITQGKEWHGEFCNRKKNGDLYWESASISPITDPTGRITHFVAVKEDITERKRTDALLQESEARYRQLVENASDIIYRADMQGRFVYVNPPALRIMGFAGEAEVLGRHYTELVAPAWRHKTKRFYERQYVSGESSSYYEFPAIRPDGSEIWVGQNVQLITQEGQAIGFQAVARDITEIKRAQALANEERARAEALLLNILPEETAARLKSEPFTGRPIAEYSPAASILFADVVDFTLASARLSAADVVAILDRLFTRFDELVERSGLEKIKTIGDCYMVAAGVPRARADHAVAITRLALEMRQAVAGMTFALPNMGLQGAPVHLAFQMRIGISSGPVVAGVIGRKKFIYDLWGDSVNTASRMEENSQPGAIQVAEATYELIKDCFECEFRGIIPIKGKGRMSVWHVVKEI